eukprot:4591921-Pleurochrysis_carterae.AAC.1
MQGMKRERGKKGEIGQGGEQSDLTEAKLKQLSGQESADKVCTRRRLELARQREVRKIHTRGRFWQQAGTIDTGTRAATSARRTEAGYHSGVHKWLKPQRGADQHEMPFNSRCNFR